MGNQGKGISQARERLQKINSIWEMVRYKPTGYSKKKLIADVCIKYGTRRRTSMEYIQILIDAEKLEEINGILHA